MVLEPKGMSFAVVLALLGLFGSRVMGTATGIQIAASGFLLCCAFLAAKVHQFCLQFFSIFWFGSGCDFGCYRESLSTFCAWAGFVASLSYGFVFRW
jgi:hypothetical protein